MSATEASQQANRAGIDPKRLVVIGLLLLGAVIALFLGNVLESVFASAGLSRLNAPFFEGIDNARASNLIGFGVALGLGAYVWFNARAHTVAMEIATELMRVTWPSWEETRVSTFAVVVASIIAAVVLFGIDTLSFQVMVKWLPRLWGKL